MKKKILAFVIGLLFIGVNLVAAAGDLIVNGNVGIGTTAPGYKLDVAGGHIKISTAGYGLLLPGSVNTDAQINFVAAGATGENKLANFPLYNNSMFLKSASDKLYFYSDKGSVGNFLSLTTDGNVGIGTTGPVAALDVKGGVDGTNMFLRNSTGQTANYLSFYEATGNQWNVGNYATSKFAIFQNGTAPGSSGLVFSGGNVGIGTTDPGSYKLYVNGSAYSTGGWAGSDIRWKKNIVPIENALDSVLKLQGVNYEWRVEEYKDKNFDEGKQIGVIAQDVEKVLPKLVRTDNEGYKAVSYEKLTVVLVEAIKEQQKQIKELEDRIKRLEKLQ